MFVHHRIHVSSNFNNIARCFESPFASERMERWHFLIIKTF